MMNPGHGIACVPFVPANPPAKPARKPAQLRASNLRAHRAAAGWTAGHDRALHSRMEAIGLRPSPTQETTLGVYARLLLKWNRTYNLLGTGDADSVLESHVLDALAVLPALRRWLPHDCGPLVDVGSGGGLPGIPIAIMRPELPVRLVEPTGKKAAFLRQAVAECRLPWVTVHEARLEALTRDELMGDLPPAEARGAIAGPHFICRAFATLADFARLCQPRLGVDSLVMAMKSQRADEEIAALRASLPGIDVAAVEPLSVPGKHLQRSLVVMRPTRGATAPATTKSGT